MLPLWLLEREPFDAADPDRDLWDLEPDLDLLEATLLALDLSEPPDFDALESREPDLDRLDSPL